MSLPNIPRFVFDGNTLDLSIPMRPTVPDDETEGGSVDSAAGLPAAYEVRRYDLLQMELRFLDSEWLSVLEFIRYGQRSTGTFSVYPDLNIDEYRTCYLHAPRMGENVRPARGEYFGEYVLGIVVRSISGPFDVRYFDAV